MKVVNRIKNSDDFRLTIKKGKAANCKSFTIHYVKNDLPYTRVGISASTKLGNAVIRSRIKRQTREMMDSLVNYSMNSLDIVIVIRKPFLDNTFSDNKSLLSDLLDVQVGINK